jgi:hypothetical protein
MAFYDKIELFSPDSKLFARFSFQGFVTKHTKAAGDLSILKNWLLHTVGTRAVIDCNGKTEPIGVAINGPEDWDSVVEMMGYIKKEGRKNIVVLLTSRYSRHNPQLKTVDSASEDTSEDDKKLDESEDDLAEQEKTPEPKKRRRTTTVILREEANAERLVQQQTGSRVADLQRLWYCSKGGGCQNEGN